MKNHEATGEVRNSVVIEPEDQDQYDENSVMFAEPEEEQPMMVEERILDNPIMTLSVEEESP